MRESYWGYWIILLGIFVIVIMMLISNLTTTNTQDYYLIKEVTEASMVDAVDLAYYRQSGELKINREKFVESFIRRFAENVALNTYKIDFYAIYESPPKVSVRVTTQTSSYTIASDSTSFDIINEVDAILELDGNVTAGGSFDNTIDGSTGSGGSSSNGSNNGGSNTGGGSGDSGTDYEEGEYPLGSANMSDLREILEENEDDFYNTESIGNGTRYTLTDYNDFVDKMIMYYAAKYDYDEDDFLRGDVEYLCEDLYNSVDHTFIRQD